MAIKMAGWGFLRPYNDRMGIRSVHPRNRGHHGLKGMKRFYGHNGKGDILGRNRFSIVKNRVFDQMERNGQAVL